MYRASECRVVCGDRVLLWRHLHAQVSGGLAPPKQAMVWLCDTCPFFCSPPPPSPSVASSAYRASTAYQAVKLFRRLRVVLFQLVSAALGLVWGVVHMCAHHWIVAIHTPQVGVGGYEAFYWYYSMRERYRGHTPGGKCTNISFL